MSQYPKITLIKNAIHNPSEPRHYMTLTQASQIRFAKIDNHILAQSDQCLIMREIAHIIIDPIYYYSKQSVDKSFLEETEKITSCPLKGRCRYYNAIINGEVYENIGWNYFEPIAIAAKLRDYIAFDPRVVSCLPQG